MGKRKSVGTRHSMCVQPTFLIGTYDADHHANFAPITWLSVVDDGERFLLVISMFGNKKTKTNLKETMQLSANLVSTDMLGLLDYLGSVSGHDGLKDRLSYDISEALTVNAPTLDVSRWVYELEVVKTIPCGASDTYFCRIENVQVAEDIDICDGIDLTRFDPLIYSGDYHSVGKHLGTIGDFLDRRSS